MNIYKNKRIIFLSLLILLIIPNYAYSAQTTSFQTTFCNNLMSRPTALSQVNYTSSNNLIKISMLLIIIMATITGMVFAIGYGFNINQLKRFSKIEFGEIIVTLLIIIVFLGTSSILNRFSIGNQTFVTTCKSLSTYSITLLPHVIYLTGVTLIYSLVQNFNVSFKFDAQTGPEFPVEGGFSSSLSIQPFMGLSVLDRAITGSLTVILMILSLLLGIILFLSIIYALFPLFFFAGIILRTVPWTRSAGGALLGIFIGFYIFFPIVLNMMLPAIQNSNFNFSPSVPSFSSSSTSSISSAAKTVLSLLGGINNGNTSPSASLLRWLIDTIISPVIYAFTAVIISILLSLDFAETIGDFLGSPSLSSKGVLGRLI